ncbi:TetR family transcriptional regulator [Methanobrevibacter oralis]
MDAVFKVFLKKGYFNVTMEDIINETSLSKGGFYYYFNIYNKY